MYQRRHHINYSPGIFDILIFTYVCFVSLKIVSLKYYFVTAGVILRVSILNIYALSTKNVLSSQSEFSPTILFIFCLETGQLPGQICVKLRLN